MKKVHGVLKYLIFGVDASSSSHIDNHKNKFLILGGEDAFGINGSFGAPE